MKYFFLAGCLLLSAGAASAQASRVGIFDVNNYRGPVSPTTSLWQDCRTLAAGPYTGLEFPKTTDPSQVKRYTTFASGLWLGGQDTNQVLYTAAETYRQGTPPDAGFWTGPASQAVAGSSGNNPAYDSVWTVTRAEIATHRAQYAQPGYQMPRAIRSWPGHVPGTTPTERLAPFADLNGNNLYEPALGEYPDVPGDQALFYVCNDIAGTKRPFTPAMGVDIHGLVYGYAGSDPTDPLANTAFVRYTIHNRSNRAYQDLFIGHWADMDLGYFNDDFMGTDRARRMMYIYNGDDNDEGVSGYGSSPPAQTVALLSDSLYASVFYNNDFSVNGNPSRAQHYYNYLRAKVTAGADYQYGGDGLIGTNGQPWRWMYDGDPVTGTGWSEASVNNVPGDRRGVLSAGPYTLPVGGSRVFEVAYIVARSGSSLGSLASLQQATTVVQAQYAAGLLAAPRAVERAATLALAPNPASRTATIHAALPAGTASATLTLRDALGRPVRTVAVRTATTALDLRGLAAGLYHATLTTPDGRALASQRLVVTAPE